MVEQTLTQMRMGGIFDHLGFGFHRYSTDARWLVPHFEKMLYDQALIINAYTEAYQVTAEKAYAETAREVLTYVLRDMVSPEGGFYSAQDADSEGEEGKFYLWTLQEVQKVLGNQDAELVRQVYNLKKDGNFVHEAPGQHSQDNILHLTKPPADFSRDVGIPNEQLHSRLKVARQKLFSIRKKRIHPFKDDKILTDWNGLMIAALAKAGRALDEPKYTASAAKAADFILAGLQDDQGRLLKRYRNGKAGLPAHIDDYAFFVWGLIELYEASFKPKYLREAVRLNDIMVEDFWDNQKGGFFLTSADDKELPIRPKDFYDGAVPSGNSVAALNLFRLSHLTGKTAYATRAEQLIKAFSTVVESYPAAFAHLMQAVGYAVYPVSEIVIVGKPGARDTTTMLSALHNLFLPGTVLLFKPLSAGKDSEIAKIAPFTANYTAIRGKATAYVCQDFICKLPTTDVAEMLSILNVNPILPPT